MATDEDIGFTDTRLAKVKTASPFATLLVGASIIAATFFATAMVALHVWGAPRNPLNYLFLAWALFIGLLLFGIGVAQYNASNKASP